MSDRPPPTSNSPAPSATERLQMIRLATEPLPPLELLDRVNVATLLEQTRLHLSELHSLAEVREVPFTSNIPLFSSLICTIRTAWNSVSTKPWVGALLRQQNQFNQALVEVIANSVTYLATEAAHNEQARHRLQARTAQLQQLKDENARLWQEVVTLETAGKR